MTWTCEQIEARLSDYLEGALTLAEKRDFEAHANSCANCAPLVATVSHALASLHAMQAIEAPPRLVHNILEQTRRPSGLFGWLGGLLAPRFIYGAISVAATLVIFLTASGFSFRKPKLADLSPVNVYRNADRQVHLVYARSTKFVSDLRVVYEIQSRLSKDSELPADQENTIPQSKPANPGSTDTTKPASPKEQNRANGLRREIEVLAAEVPVVSARLSARFTGRRIR